MIAKAIVKKASIAPRKARLVVDLIRGQQITRAKAILTFTPKAASHIVLKLLNSAEANIQPKIDVGNIYVSKVYVNEGVFFKRLFARAKGSGNMIKKRTSHITLMLDVNNQQLTENKKMKGDA